MPGNTVGLDCSDSADVRDEVYYWDTITLSVDGVLFKVPKYQFTIGSDYFTNKYLSPPSHAVTAEEGDEVDVQEDVKTRPVVLEGIIKIEEDFSAPQFRTFLKILFPIHSTSPTLTFNGDEWHTILTLSTAWHFYDIRALAIQHLNAIVLSKDPVQQILIGREEFVPDWVTAGYGALVMRDGYITEEESEAIGNATAVRLYIVRHSLAKQGEENKGQKTLADLLQQRLGEELDDLRALYDERISRVQRERREKEKEAREAERVRVELEKAWKEEERKKERARAKKLNEQRERALKVKLLQDHQAVVQRGPAPLVVGAIGAIQTVVSVISQSGTVGK